MKKAQRKLHRRSEPQSHQLRAQIDPVALRRQIADLVRAEALQMVEKTIDEVHKGHYQALKYLFEMVGIFPASGDEDNSREKSLAEILLRHLGISETRD
jgi:hypothetical protein